MYKVNGEVLTLDEVLGMIYDNVTKGDYDEMLDDCYEEIEICGCFYSPSATLYRVDEIAYNCGFNDYKDSLVYGDLKYEIDRMSGGEVETYYDVEVECIEIDYLTDLDEEELSKDVFDNLINDEYVKHVKEGENRKYIITLINDDEISVYLEEIEIK